MFAIRPYGAAPPTPTFSGLAGITYGAGNAVLSLRFDDGPVEDYSVVFPLLEARGLVGGFALVRTLLVGGVRLSLAQALEMQSAGHEIMCHTRHHGTYPATTDEFYDETVVTAWEMRALGFNIVSFVQPGTWGELDNLDWFYSSMEGGWLRQNFAATEAYASIGIVEWPPEYALPRTERHGVMHMGGITSSLASQIEYIDNLIANQRGGEILFHSADIGVGENISLADFTSLLDYMAAAVAAGTLTVLTPTQQLYATEAA